MIKLIYGTVLALGLAACQGDDNSAAKAHVEEVNKLTTATMVTSTQDVKKNDVVKVELQKHLNKPSQDVINEVVKLAEQTKPAVATKATENSQPAVESVAIKQEQAAEAAASAQKKAVDESINNKLNQAAKAPVAALSLGDAVAGKKLAKRCSSCHSFAMKDKVGPHLQGVFNRAAGQSGFKKHSAALKAADWNWDEAHLVKWLCNSKASIKEFSGNAKAKTKMPNQKMCDKKGLDIVAYLKTI